MCAAALVRDEAAPRASTGVPITADRDVWRRQSYDVVVEVLGGIEPARTLVAATLSAGIPVVTANKSLVAAHGVELQRLAASRGTALYFEAAVLAGVPCVNTLARRPLASGSGAWAGIVNGTSNFILTQMSRGQTLEDALVDAVARGYAEPTSDADVSGRDAVEKLTILLQLAGHIDVATSDFTCRGIDALEPWHFAMARRLGGVIKPVALADTGVGGGAWVGPAFVPASHAFARIDGVTNVLAVGRGDSIVWFSGPGAGPDVTAATVLDDVVEAAAGQGRGVMAPVAATLPVAARLRSPKPGTWFLALENVSSSDGELAEFLAGHHLPAVMLVSEGHRRGVIAASAPIGPLLATVDALESTGVRAAWWPVLEVARV